MKIFLLSWDGLNPETNERIEPYDRFQAFVIAAPSEKEAREMAFENKDGSFPKHSNRWLDEKTVECKEIASDSFYTEPTVVLHDYYSG